MSDIIEHSE